jgi:hypothetical protein
MSSHKHGGEFAAAAAPPDAPDAPSRELILSQHVVSEYITLPWSPESQARAHAIAQRELTSAPRVRLRTRCCLRCCRRALFPATIWSLAQRWDMVHSVSCTVVACCAPARMWPSRCWTWRTSGARWASRPTRRCAPCTGRPSTWRCATTRASWSCWACASTRQPASVPSCWSSAAAGTSSALSALPPQTCGAGPCSWPRRCATSTPAVRCTATSKARTCYWLARTAWWPNSRT